MALDEFDLNTLPWKNQLIIGPSTVQICEGLAIPVRSHEYLDLKSRWAADYAYAKPLHELRGAEVVKSGQVD